jgi:integration host factor subunit alpha
LKNSLRKLDIVEKLEQSLEIQPKVAVDLYEAFFQEIREALIAEGRVKITSFATFSVVQKKERWGRNPKTNRPAVITPRKSMIFRPSRYLRDTVSAGMKEKKRD